MLTKDTYHHIEEEHNLNAAAEVVPYLINIFNPSSVIDVGCGIGTWLWQFKQEGVQEVLGIDTPFVDKRLLSKYLNNNEFKAHDLSEQFDIGKKYDLAISLEVAEHLPLSSAQTFVKSLSSHADVVVFSAAVPYQQGRNHINEQWPEYWCHLFEQEGYVAYDFLREYFWNNKKVDLWYRQNFLIYARPSHRSLINFKPARRNLAIIHPELFELRMKKLLSLRQIVHERVVNPKPGGAFKLLLRSFAKMVKS